MGLFSWFTRLLVRRIQSKTERQLVATLNALQQGTANVSPSQVTRQQKPARKLNLDPGQFAALTSDQVRRRARLQGGSLFRNPWFGRRDLIPPVTDDRTALIDRGMVGLGLLTPEQLVEIHEVGVQMEKVRPDLVQAGTIADEAVKLDEE